MYHKFLELVRANEYKIKHGQKGLIEKSWIDYTEGELGFPLPDSYKWWLQEFEYFKVGNEYIKYITSPEFHDLANIDDILYVYNTDKENGSFPGNQLTILEEGEGDESYYFLVEPGLPGNEYRVCCRDYVSDDDDFYADNFIKFLEMKIHEMR
ncbi:hypothetical protein D0T84_14290 [Dysgonomonas sp. 521]|uniref:SMI1/KNR4 family protein n=1 Tax=Dysgonomonas sp. 521 TaxID=2302932 RepID=UPI0013D1F479|nr:SMI1/KNR4 family protein [Dysgonomonas sp. 521]NDV96073.1 hypothetical protein [Dysgonomonas sp. 521]